MDLYERLGWMLFGAVIGLFAGYLLRYLQDLKEELDEVDGIVKKELGKRQTDRIQNQDGGMTVGDAVRNLALFIVVAVTVAAALISQHASDKANDALNRENVRSGCNQEFLVKTVKALNERTEFSSAQATANVTLQQAQADFFSLLLRKPPEPEATRSQAAQDYLKALREFIDVNSKTAQKARSFPYPTPEALRACYNK